MTTVRNKLVAVAVAVVVFSATPCRAGLFGPSNYDECVLKHMKGVTSDEAAKTIRRSCRDQFASENVITPSGGSPLPADVLFKITGHAGSNGYRFYGNIYNGNKEWTVSRITVRITQKPGDKKTKNIQTIPPQDYNIDILVSPLTTTNFEIAIDRSDTNIEWEIVEARGLKR